MHLQSAVTQFLDMIIEKLNPLVTYLSENLTAYDALVASILVLLVVLLFLTRRKKPLQTAVLTQPRQADIHAVAGDDVLSTQLDLAKAYIEMNQKKIASEMLNAILKKGSNRQKDEARHLISSL
jgi:FimV-like protein